MSNNASRLPERPSLEQLHKQAKDLLRQYRAANPSAEERFRASSPRQDKPIGADGATLAGAQFVLAREYGFPTWAKLIHHVESLHPSGLEKYEHLARQLAAAYSTADKPAIREINWDLGTAFVWYDEPEKMHERLATWFASDARTPDLALNDARAIVAHSYGFDSWAKFVESLSQPPADPRSAPVFHSSTPPFYVIDWKENRISVRGPQSERDWDTLFGVMREHRITQLSAGGMADTAMEELSRLDHVTHLQLEGSSLLTDEGAQNLSRMTQLQYLELGGWRSPITDRGLEPLRHLTELKGFHSPWTQGISDAGIANLAACNQLEFVSLIGTHAGDGAIRAMTGKSKLREFTTGRGVTDAGLPLLHELPVFKTWQGGEIRYDLMSFTGKPNHLMIDGPFTNQGMQSLVGLDGLFGLGFFWHCPAFTGAGLEPLRHLPNLGFLGCQDQRCDDEAMQHIAAIPNLRMLMGQGAVAGDAGFEALSRSQTLEFFWGRDCPNLGGRGFQAMAAMPALLGLAVSCKNVDDAALSSLQRFPALRQLMPMDVLDAGFRHVGACGNLERLWCMYCRDTGDGATEHIAGLRLKTYYAGSTLITDRSLEILGRMHSLERLEFWQCSGITDAGVAHLAALPQLREITLDGLAGVSNRAQRLFPAHVRVKYSG